MEHLPLTMGINKLMVASLTLTLRRVLYQQVYDLTLTLRLMLY